MSELQRERTLLDEAAIAESLARVAREIVTSTGGTERLAIVGVHTGGVPLASRICDAIAAQEGHRPHEGMIDITLYRDDVFIGLPNPVVGRTELPFDMDGTRLVLVDDVLYTGRTVRSALDALVDYGRPEFVRLAVLVDRGHRELPIQADYVGTCVETSSDHSVKLSLRELGDAADEVALYRATPGEGS